MDSKQTPVKPIPVELTDPKAVYAIPAKPSPKAPWWQDCILELVVIWMCAILIVIVWME